MRWEALFEDLQSQFEAVRRAEDDDVVAELTEAELGGVHLADRLRARVGAEVTLRLRSGQDLRGRLTDAAPQWLLLAEGDRRVLVPVGAVTAAWPLGGAAPEPAVAERRLRVTHVLRALAREGTRVRVTCEGGVYAGWLERVGADHVDLRRDDAAGEVVSLALGAVLTVSHP